MHTVREYLTEIMWKPGCTSERMQSIYSVVKLAETNGFFDAIDSWVEDATETFDPKSFTFNQPAKLVP